MKPVVKIYGERNTGTNYFEKLLERNFRLHLLPGGHPETRWLNATFRGSDILRECWHYWTFPQNLGWKHTAIRLPKFLPAFQRLKNPSIVFIVKNPYSWVLSLKKRPYQSRSHAGGSLDEFVASPWRLLHREHLDAVVPGPAALWSLKVRSYRDCLSARPECVFVKYEDLVCDPFQVLETLAARLGFDRPREWSNINDSTKGDEANYAFYRDYYLNERWRASLTPNALAVITRQLDISLVDDCGYELLG